MSDCYYDASNEALENLTAVYDLIWPIAVGLWNLRCSVNGVKHEMPFVTEKQLMAKFSEGSGIHGVNYKRNFIDKSWKEQQKALAIMLLNNTIPIYEGWIDSLLQTELPIYNSETQMKAYRKLESGFQFSEKIANAIATCIESGSLLMTTNFYPKYRDKKKRSVNKIEKLLLCYRVYKEMRNCCMHKGNIVNQVLVDAYNKYSTNVFSETDLDIKELPMFAPPVLGSPVELSLRSAVELGDIVLKLIVSIDAELVKAERAETIFNNRIANSSIVGKKLKADDAQALGQIKNYVTRVLGLPTPINLLEIKNYFLSKGFVTQDR